MKILGKYSMKSLNDLMGLEEESKKVLDFLKNFNDYKKKSMLLVGPEGSGKTSIVYAACNSLGFDVLEVNASDKRNAENIKSIVGSASRQMGLFNQNKAILIDEVDGLSGNNDRGGVKEINLILKSTKFPIIMTANDEYSPRLESIKNNTNVIKFKKRAYWDVYRLIKLVNDSENLGLSSVGIKKLASMAQGDIRSALNDLENVSCDEDINELSERIKECNIFDSLKIIFKSKTFDSLYSSMDNLRDMDVGFALLWIMSNIINEYEKPHEIISAYDYCSKADVFLGRIYKRMHWRFMLYARLLSSIGVGLSKDDMYRKFSRFSPPQRFKIIAKYSKEKEKMKEFSQEMAKVAHCSAKKAAKEYLPYAKFFN